MGRPSVLLKFQIQVLSFSPPLPLSGAPRNLVITDLILWL